MAGQQHVRAAKQMKITSAITGLKQKVRACRYRQLILICSGQEVTARLKLGGWQVEKRERINVYAINEDGSKGERIAVEKPHSTRDVLQIHQDAYRTLPRKPKFYNDDSWYDGFSNRRQI
jgi:hypothetical protein